MKAEKLTLFATIIAKPESRELVKSELFKLIEPTRAEEGCLNYDLHQDNKDENIFYFHENWANYDVWKNGHMPSAHIAAYIAATEGHFLLTSF